MIQSTQFNFQDYLEFGTPDHKPTPNVIFLQWFIGFFEAEGSLIQWKDNGKQRFEMTISQKDPSLMYTIRSKLGFGNVISFNQNGQTYWQYQVGGRVNLRRLILLFNGNLIGSKKNYQFKIWLLLINQTFLTTYEVILPTCEVSLETAWLAGFCEGDAGFWAGSKNSIRRNRKGEPKYNLKMKFYITQKNEYILLKQIKSLFQISSNIYSITNGHSNTLYNRLETSNLKSHKLILDYLNKYPFLGQRKITFGRWERLLWYRTKDYPITEKSIKKFKRLIDATKIANLSKH